MEYQLKNGKTVTIRPPRPDDAAALIRIMTTADEETPYLGRNPGEFRVTEEREREIIEKTLAGTDSMWFVAEYDGELVGQCSAGLVRRSERFRHRAEVAFVLLRACWNLGIGGKMMEECLRWCREHGVTQAELDVVTANTRAIRMYESFGFTICGTIPDALRYPDGSTADEYRMIKKL